MVDQLNAGIRALAEAHEVAVIDLNPLLSENGRLQEDFTVDGVHFNEAAYAIWAEKLKATMKSMREASRKVD